jgi:choline dehydrogenase-like flavoprotein
MGLMRSSTLNSHRCGTPVAGRDLAAPVLGPYCRTQDLENLWVLGSSSFPSSVAINPAITIAAPVLAVVAASDLAS